MPHIVRITTFVGHFKTGYHRHENHTSDHRALVISDRKSSEYKFKNKGGCFWHTYVTKTDGSIMHFDIIAPSEVKDTTVIYGYGKEYLKTKGREGQALTSKECRFCHVRVLQAQWEVDIKSKGNFILEMENCN